IRQKCRQTRCADSMGVTDLRQRVTISRDLHAVLSRVWPRRLLEEVALFIGVLRAAEKGNRVCAVNRNLPITQLLGCDPSLVANFLDLARDAFGRVLPTDLFPMVATRRAIARSREALRRSVSRKHRDALYTQRSAIHDVIVIAFHGDQVALAHGGDHPAST